MARLLFLSFVLAIHSITGRCQKAEWNTPSAGNPIIPGYFADPTIRKFGDTYYLYATTDGTGNGYGPPQVWISKDFVNWTNVTMNWPTTEVVWAPDVVQQPDGSYRYYYCTPCEIRVGESDSPTGPWKNRLGASDAVLVPDRFVHNAITLDPQLFVDDDGSEYLYFGTWGIYKGFGCGVAKLSADGKSFSDKKLIPNTEIIDFFEAPYVFKKDGKYYFTYSSGSCHDDTYRVQYAISETGPMGPYTYKGCILKTNSDQTVHGPGHHSILKDNDDYYIIYHRHNLPRSIHGFNRQICIDKMEFSDNGEILPVTPTHDGAIPSSLRSRSHNSKNLALGSQVQASSEYSEWFKASYAIDDNNATLWRAAACNQPASLTIDLGQSTSFNEIFTQFEYATFFYQYKIETSNDGKNWTLFADKTSNTHQGSPMVDTGEAKARYIRITITGTQKNGHFPAIWNVKVFHATPNDDPLKQLPVVKTDEQSLLAGYPWIHTRDEDSEARRKSDALGNRIISINASDYDPGTIVTTIGNKGIAGDFICKDGIAIVPIKDKYAFRFDGNHHLESTFGMPKTMVYNAPYTINAWILNPEVDELECIAQFMPVNNDLATIELRNGKNAKEGIVAHNASFENIGAASAIKPGEWQFWSVVYDGYMEKIYCNGKKVAEQNSFLMLRPEGKVTIGCSSFGNNPFSGYLHNLDFYDRVLNEDEISNAYLQQSDITENQKEILSKINKIQGKKFNLCFDQLSPEVIKLYLADSDNSASDNSLYEYAFGTDKGHLTPSATNETVITLNKKQILYGQVKDLFGNSSAIMKKKLKPSAKNFQSLSEKLEIQPDNNGLLTLESDNKNLDADASHNGPMSLVEIDGDFLLQCKVTDMTGMNRHSTPGYNEGGIIIIDELPNNRQNLVHLGVFPNYNCGNMLTVVRGYQRPQYKNNKGWSFDPYIQLERKGKKIHARTSLDGITWTEMPNSPVDCSFFKGKRIKAGVYQTTYSENHAFMTFSDIKIWKKTQ